MKTHEIVGISHSLKIPRLFNPLVAGLKLERTFGIMFGCSFIIDYLGKAVAELKLGLTEKWYFTLKLVIFFINTRLV